MGGVIYTDLDRLTASEFHKVSLGLKPSGHLHLGTALTFLQGMMVISKNPTASLDVAVMDLDLDFQRGKDFVSYSHKPYTVNGYTLFKDYIADESRLLLHGLADYFGVDPLRIRVSQFSGITSHPQFQRYLTDLFGSVAGRTLLKKTIVPGKRKTKDLLAPICDGCGHSSNKPPKFKGEEDLELQTYCYNQKCSVDEYAVKLTQPGKVNIFYLVDPIRDLIPDKEGKVVDLHIFGGDYGIPYDTSGLPKAERVSKLMSALSDRAPTIYVGPTLTKGDVKIGKSKGNGYTIGELRERFPNWIERSHSLLMDNPSQKKLDLSVLGQKYFS